MPSKFETKCISTEVREYVSIRTDGVLSTFDYVILCLTVLCTGFLYISGDLLAINWPIIILAGVFIVHVVLRCIMVASSETLTVIRDLGVQKETVSIFGSKRYSFVDAGHITDVFITETVGVFALSYCLVLKVDTMPNLFVCFEQNIPRLDDLVTAYQGVRHILFGDPEVDVRESGPEGLPSSMSIPANLAGLHRQ